MMETGQLNLLIAFFGGVTSFFLPCILPLVPTYLLYLSGERGHPFRNALFFVLGFSLVFIVLLGLPASYLGNLLFTYKEPLVRVGGAVLILLGLSMLGLRLPFGVGGASGLVAGYRADPSRPWGAFLLGTVLAIGWTPCIGPVLGLILALTFNAGGMQGLGYITAYAAGLAVPFLVVALFADRALRWLRRSAGVARLVEYLAGGTLVLVGILMATGFWSQLSKYLARFGAGF